MNPVELARLLPLLTPLSKRGQQISLELSDGCIPEYLGTVAGVPRAESTQSF